MKYNNSMKVAYLFGSLNRGGTETLYLDFFRKVKNPLFDVVGLYRKNGSLSDDFLCSFSICYLVQVDTY